MLKLILEVRGDTAEIGVFRGASSWFICRGTQGSGRTHYAVDSFAGLSEPTPHDGVYWQSGDMRAGEAEARQLLEGFDVEFLVGWVPGVLSRLPDGPYALVHVDLDLYEPTLASFAHAHDRMSPGGILLCDDYGFATCPGARRAVDEFMASRPEPVIHLPSGQGLVIRGRERRFLPQRPRLTSTACCRAAPRPCPLCSGTKHREVESFPYAEIWDRLYRDWGVRFSDDVIVESRPTPHTHLVRCDGCGLQFFSPLHPGTERYYQEPMRGIPYASSRWEFELVASKIAAGESVLDPGCAPGIFCRALRGVPDAPSELT